MNDIICSLNDLRQWSKLSLASVESSAMLLTKHIGKAFECLGVSVYGTGTPIASFIHTDSDLEFQLIPGGEAKLGLSMKEYEAIKDLPGANVEILNDLRGSISVEIPPFLISRLPIQEGIASNLMEVNWSLFRPDFQPLLGESSEVPIYLTRSELEIICSRYSFSIPTEAQWEYALRGGSSTPFYFGSKIPDDDQLAKILSTDFGEDCLPNQFGIIGMLTGGWCNDSFMENRFHGQDEGPPYVIRGGAAIYWPWQNAGEWMLALSAMRRSSYELEDQTCSAHVVVPVT